MQTSRSLSNNALAQGTGGTGSRQQAVLKPPVLTNHKTWQRAMSFPNNSIGVGILGFGMACLLEMGFCCTVWTAMKGTGVDFTCLDRSRP